MLTIGEHVVQCDCELELSRDPEGSRPVAARTFTICCRQSAVATNKL